MNQLSEEQQRRVEQIKRYSRLSYTVSDDNQVAAGLLRDARTDIEFLLSLLSSDSQATKLDHTKLAHEIIARNLTHMPSEDLHRLQIPRLVEEITAALDSTTTAMRDKCVEKVEEAVWLATIDFKGVLNETQRRAIALATKTYVEAAVKTGIPNP